MTQSLIDRIQGPRFSDRIAPVTTVDLCVVAKRSSLGTFGDKALFSRLPHVALARVQGFVQVGSLSQSPTGMGVSLVGGVFQLFPRVLHSMDPVSDPAAITHEHEPIPQRVRDKM